MGASKLILLAFSKQFFLFFSFLGWLLKGLIKFTEQQTIFTEFPTSCQLTEECRTGLFFPSFFSSLLHASLNVANNRSSPLEKKDWDTGWATADCKEASLPLSSFMHGFIKLSHTLTQHRNANTLLLSSSLSRSLTHCTGAPKTLHGFSLSIWSAESDW